MKPLVALLRCLTVLVSFFILLTHCQPVPPPTDPLVYISSNRVDVARKANEGCAFRYVIANSFGKLDNTLQQNAIKAGFDLWQKINPNVAFLQFDNAAPRRELVVRFVDAASLQSAEGTVPVGLIRGNTNSISALRRENSTTSAILLSNSYNWDIQTLTRAVAYHAGLYLGMNTSNDQQSLMYPFVLNKTTRIVKNDSTLINQLYSQPCRDLRADYLPLSLKLLQPIVKTLKIEKQGIIKITASGVMRVGVFVGNSGPEGKEDGVFGFSLGAFGYNIDPNLNHASVIYRLNKASKWTYCGKGCEFSTNGAQYVDLELQVNDSNLKDNIGEYDIIIDYK